jgi:hypothetical protein
MEKSVMESSKLSFAKKRVLWAVLAVTALAGQSSAQTSRFPTDLSNVRGFNYTPALVQGSPRHHVDCWTSYDPEVIEFDLDLAARLKLNQCRVFVPYQSWLEDKDGLAGKLEHFVRACHKRGIGVMPVVGYLRDWTRDPSLLPQAREWAEFLVETLSDEEGLAFWDVMNEPDWPTDEELVRRECEYAKYMAGVFRELDPKTPVTIGMAFVPGMEEMADYMDVLSFHDYLQTRGAIRGSIERAKAFAEKVHKPVFDTEMGCVARANPYDVTLEEHMKANVGWYIWELMIVREGWGKVHGVFYEDGSVRDPSIPAAIMGFFRKRDADILPSVPDDEGWIRRVIKEGRVWMGSADVSNIGTGYDLAETAANLLEAGELAPMHIPPTQRITVLRAGPPDVEATRRLLGEFIQLLEPYALEEKK